MGTKTIVSLKIYFYCCLALERKSWEVVIGVNWQGSMFYDYEHKKIRVLVIVRGMKNEWTMAGKQSIVE